MRMRAAAVFAAALLLVGPGPAAAQQVIHLGPELSFGGDQDVGIGGRIKADLVAIDHVSFLGTFDWFFPDEPVGQDRTYWELNGNLAYFFEVPSAPTLAPYAGGGLNIAHFSREFADGSDISDTDLGLNLLGGIEFETRTVTPFVELRIELEGGDQVVVTGGILF